MHYAMIIKENSKQNLDIWPNLTCFFRSLWFSVLPLGRLCHSTFSDRWPCDGFFGQNAAIFERNSLPHASDPNIRKNCTAWANGYADIVIIHLFSTFCEELVPLLNTFLTYSTLTVCHFQHFKCFWTLNSIFYTKFDAYSLIHFFRQQKIANTRKILLIFLPLTNKRKMLHCWNCVHTFGTSVPT